MAESAASTAAAATETSCDGSNEGATPDDAAERLLRTFAPDVASCSSPYLSRYDPDYVVHGFDGQRLPEPKTPRVQPILSSGFGCLMVRAELLRRYVFQVPPGRKWYDPAFFGSIDRRRWRCLVDWSCECGHVGERRMWGKTSLFGPLRRG